MGRCGSICCVCSLISRLLSFLTNFLHNRTILTGIILSFCTAPNITGVVLILTPIAIFSSYYRSKVLRGAEIESRKAYEEASSVAAEAIKVPFSLSPFSLAII